MPWLSLTSLVPRLVSLFCAQKSLGMRLPGQRKGTERHVCLLLQPLENCVGCLQKMPQVKLQKRCAEPEVSCLSCNHSPHLSSPPFVFCFPSSLLLPCPFLLPTSHLCLSFPPSLPPRKVAAGSVSVAPCGVSLA